jgi:putative two-component system response regulator
VLPADLMPQAPPADAPPRAVPRFAALGRGELREALEPHFLRLHAALPDAEARQAVDNALALCRALYANARSTEALALARAALDRAREIADPALLRKACTACGILSADTADLAGALEHHAQALRLAAGDPVEMGRVWNMIGAAMGISGHYELAARCYWRALEPLEALPGPEYIRYAVRGNLADCYYQLGACEEGVPYALAALGEESAAFREQDLHNALILRRNLVRLLVGAGRLEEARPHVLDCAALAERTQTPRALIAASVTRATYELALGQTDIALTRLEKALAQSREVPAALRDTLACVIRAEEAAGNVERALVRLNELSDHIYRLAVERARSHVEFATLSESSATHLERDQRQARARLVSKTSPPEAPPGWAALERLAVGAALRRDPTGWHGKRVGALVKALAVAMGVDPLPAMEMGLAAELHDVGLLSVPEAILRKGDGLNNAERAIVRRHVDAGSEMLRDDRHPRILLAREIAKYHHARWDGEGYPERVAGKRIPFAARACAVADAYDAMVCGLGASPPRSMNEALEELGREAGRQFDPEAVSCFDQLIRAETEDLGMDLESNSGLAGFQSLIAVLSEDRGFV